MRKALLCLAVTLPAAMSCASAATIDLNEIETKDLRMLYFDPTETYLTPYVGRSFENSLAFQKRTVRLEAVGTDDASAEGLLRLRQCGCTRLAERGRYSSTSRRCRQTFETFSAGRALLHHHEPRDGACRDHGRVEQRRRVLATCASRQADGASRSIRNRSSTTTSATPRVNVPRWYLEGSAVFMETWMAGGFGRAQGGYDEMVFRAMVRDNAHFYSPLGLEVRRHRRSTSRSA